MNSLIHDYSVEDITDLIKAIRIVFIDEKSTEFVN